MNIQEFLQLLIEDSDLAQRMGGATNPDEAYAIAKEAGLTDSFEIFTDTMTKVYKAQSELSEEELNAVVGGGDLVDDLKTSLYALTALTIATSGVVGASAAV